MPFILDLLTALLGHWGES